MVDKEQKLARRWLQGILTQTGDTPSELARRSGLSTTTLTRFLNSEDHSYTLSARSISKIVEMTGVPFPSLSAQNLPAPVKSEKFETVPIFDIRASAGPGAMAEDGEPIGYQPYREQELSRITRADLSDLAVIRVAGDSMEPTLTNADQVLIDRTVKKVGRDGIYILALDDELLVKRCQVDLQTREIIVKSDNPNYDTMRVSGKNKISILGRVVWIGRALG